MSQLLKTKLHIPKPRPDLIARPRLVEQLNAGLDKKLVLLSAPPGFGKTTLLSEWIAHCKFEAERLDAQPPTSNSQRCAWFALDPGDNDPARFFTYLIAAFQTIDPAIGESVVMMLRLPQLASVESLLTPLLNDLAGLSRHLTLVLDDYHVVENETIHNAITFLLDHLPEQMRLVIATRADPPLPLARWRARDRLVELRAHDLMWNADEAAAFLNKTMRLNLARAEIAALTDRTEGWIAGLQMAALSLQARTDSAEFIRAFTGSHRFVLDYLAEEILNRQTPATQDFLCQTAILDRMSASLCDAVTQRVDSQFTLQHLEQSNLFVVALDDERHWYRYHRLFADLLHQRLRGSQREIVPVLHQRASAWYEQNAQFAEAIEHALAASDFERAARLSDQVAETVLGRSEIATFLGWVARVPDEFIRARPTLRLSHLWARLLNGMWSPEIELELRELDSAETRGKIAALRAYVAGIQGDVPRANEWARQALQYLPANDALFRNFAAWLMGVLRIALGDSEAGKQALYENIRTNWQSGVPFITAATLFQLAEVHLRQGQLRQTQTLYEQAIVAATDAASQRLPIASRALIGLGEIYREWNDFETAEKFLREGIELAQKWRAAIAVGGYITLARISQAQGDPTGASAAIAQAWQLAVQDRATEFDDLGVALYRAQLWIAQGNLDAARQWARERGLDREIDWSELDRSEDFLNYHLRKYELLVLARLLLAQDRADDALAFLEPLAARMQHQNRTRLVIEALMLQASAFHQKRDPERARAALEHALALAEPEGYVRLFVDEGAAMEFLISDFRFRIGKSVGSLDVEKAERLLHYAEKLLDAFKPSQASVPKSEIENRKSEILPEPVSAREQEVLRLLAEGLSNKAIARKLVIADETVKKHLKNIYGKLGAHSRTQALARARELNLL
jgi:LuxR family maltose regulon positive regulatory protein